MNSFLRFCSVLVVLASTGCAQTGYRSPHAVRHRPVSSLSDNTILSKVEWGQRTYPKYAMRPILPVRVVEMLDREYAQYVSITLAQQELDLRRREVDLLSQRRSASDPVGSQQPTKGTATPSSDRVELDASRTLPRGDKHAWTPIWDAVYDCCNRLAGGEIPYDTWEGPWLANVIGQRFDGIERSEMDERIDRVCLMLTDGTDPRFPSYDACSACWSLIVDVTWSIVPPPETGGSEP